MNTNAHRQAKTPSFLVLVTKKKDIIGVRTSSCIIKPVWVFLHLLYNRQFSVQSWLSLVLPHAQTCSISVESLPPPYLTRTRRGPYHGCSLAAWRTRCPPAAALSGERVLRNTKSFCQSPRDIPPILTWKKKSLLEPMTLQICRQIIIQGSLHAFYKEKKTSPT